MEEQELVTMDKFVEKSLDYLVGVLSDCLDTTEGSIREIIAQDYNTMVLNANEFYNNRDEFRSIARQRKRFGDESASVLRDVELDAYLNEAWLFEHKRYTTCPLVQYDKNEYLDTTVFNGYGSMLFIVRDSDYTKEQSVFTLMSADDVPKVRDRFDFDFLCTIISQSGRFYQFGLRTKEQTKHIYRLPTNLRCYTCKSCSNIDKISGCYVRSVRKWECAYCDNEFDIMSVVHSAIELIKQGCRCYDILEQKLITEYGAEITEKSIKPWCSCITFKTEATGDDLLDIQDTFGNAIYSIEDVDKNIEALLKYHGYFEPGAYITASALENVKAKLKREELEQARKEACSQSLSKPITKTKRKAPITIVKEHAEELEKLLTERESDIETLKRDIEAIKAENSELRTQLHNQHTIAKYVNTATNDSSYEADEYYEGELEDYLRDAVKVWLQRQGQEPSRAKDVLEKFYAETDDSDYKKNLKQELMKLLSNYNKCDDTFNASMAALGFIYRGTTGHSKFCYRGNNNLGFTLPSTPSDFRFVDNNIRNIMHRVFGL